MQFADPVVILRATAADEYGNPGASWASPTQTPARAFVLGARTKAFFPPSADLREGDRLRLADGSTYSVDAPSAVKSPSRVVLVACGLTPVEA